MRFCEIRASFLADFESYRYLRTYGACLSLAHVATACFFWQPWFEKILSEAEKRICWPLLDSCYAWPHPSVSGAKALLAAYAILALASAGAWAAGKVKPGWVLLFACQAMHTAFVLQDARLAGNYHGVLFLVTCAYLFLPGRGDALVLLVPLIYFFAGTLKLPADWLSGLAIPPQLRGWPLDFLLAPPFLKPATFGVLLLELVGVWGLLRKERAIFLSVSAALVVFHLTSWGTVGFYYPTLMLLVLSVFWLRRRETGSASPGKLARPAQIALVCFCAIQLQARVRFPDAPVTGEGRWVAFSMFDSAVKCAPELRARFRQEDKLLPDRFQGIGPRFRCDPFLYYREAQRYCRLFADDPRFLDIDYSLISARPSSPTAWHLVFIRNFCKLRPTYNPLAHNAWIKFEEYVPPPR